jgi:uncharacterized protein (TIGR04255 family)
MPAPTPYKSADSKREVHFRRPPVIETVLGVQFLPLRTLTMPYLGQYWAEVRSEYPQAQVKPPLPQVIEEFPPAPVMANIEVSSEPEGRFWYISESNTELIQLQRDRFIRNWRRAETDADYPRYETLRPRFEGDWLRFLSFLEREGLGRPEVNQCEVTYINHIDLGLGWETFKDLSGVLKILAPSRPGDFLPVPEMVLANARYLMPDGKGRLHVAAQPAIPRRGGKPVVQLTLTARGAPRSSETGDILAWLDLGHTWIVEGFADITNEELQTKVWERL